MTTVTQIIGGPGTGKTTRGMAIIDDAIESGHEALDIGYASFTRAAVATAANRAADMIGMEADELTKGGWYKTLHAACYHMLSISSKQVVSDNKDSKEWLSKLYGREVNPPPVDYDTGFTLTGESDPVSRLLSWWSWCRNTLTPIHQARHRYPGTISFDDGMRQIERYERQKHIDSRVDFCDLPLRYAGIRYDTDGIRHVAAQGGVPNVRTWILDEYQDTSPALHAAAARMVSGRSVEAVYCLGDPFQSIHGHGGGRPEFLMHGFDYTGQEILHQSMRCPPAVMRLAENVISRCSDYFDRQIVPRNDKSGRVDSEWLLPFRCDTLNDDGDWLVIARTNQQATKIAGWLTKQCIPWVSTKGGGYLSPRKIAAASTAMKLRAGESVCCDEWLSLASLFKGTHGGLPILRRGFKLDMSEGIPSGMERYVNMATIANNGGTDHTRAVLASPTWYSLVDGFDKFDAAVRKCGMREAIKPRVRVGTIHSVKGDEAWNVLLYDALTGTCRANLLGKHSSDEERRVWYVGVSRAKHRLITARFSGDKNMMFR